MPLRPASLSALPLLALLLTACETTTTGGTDGGVTTVPAGITYEDIGSPCQCTVVPDPTSASGFSCAPNPTNTCAKSALTCVVGTPDERLTNAGNALWETPLFSRGTQVDGGTVIEGECTLVGTDVFPTACPMGAVAVQLSNGLTVCKRTCFTDAECGRPGWVCDRPFLDRRGLQVANPSEIPANIQVCRPACNADFPDCLRSTACVNGEAGCYRSWTTRTAPAQWGIYVGDRNGGRSCNRTTGHCDATVEPRRGAGIPAAAVGADCGSNADCNTNNLCVSDYAYSANPQGRGFCTFANCNPFPAQGVADGCGGEQGSGLTCENAFEMGMCFLDCRQGTLCSGGQKCSTPNMDLILNYNAQTGAIQPWRQTQCVECELTGVCP